MSLGAFQDEFPGCTFSRADERNLACVKFIDDMLPHERVHKKKVCPYIFFLLYSPIGFALAFVRLVVFLPLTGAVSCCVPTPCRTVFTRFVLFLLFGVWVKVKGRPNETARVWAANHTSEMDAIAIRAVGNPFILGYSFYLKLWWLKCSPLSLLNMVYVPQKSRTEGNGEARDNVRKIVHELLQTSSQSILVFPEGGLASGKVGLLQYHMFMFSLGVPVQPIKIQVSRPLPININCEVEGTTFFDNVFWFVFLPFQSFELTFLDCVSREEDEEVLAFSRRVQSLTAKAMGVRASPFLYKDKQRWLKIKHKYVKEGYQFSLCVNDITQCVDVLYTCEPTHKVRPTEEPLRDRLLRDIYDLWDLRNPGSKSHPVFLAKDG